jgi:hypothetical protein
MNEQPNHRIQAEEALARAQRNPVMSAEQSFLGAQVHALLALERRLEDLVNALRDERSLQAPDGRIVQNRIDARIHLQAANAAQEELSEQLDRATDDGWPDAAMFSTVAP